MGRSVFSHFLNLSTSSPRLVFSLSLGGYRSEHFKAPASISQCQRLGGRDFAAFRCFCSASVTEPPIEETSPSSVRKRIVSGVQPTGSIHLGNHLGAIKNWISLQNMYNTLFFIVDLHAASVFVQSHVRAHVELMWLLSSATPVGWLKKMIQFKEKSRKMGDENVGVALLTYPVLMASDILLYQSDFVPVGEDQKQHLN